MLVEFRHRSWLDDENRAATLAFLEDLGAPHVLVHPPRPGPAENPLPSVPAPPSPTPHAPLPARCRGVGRRGRRAPEVGPVFHDRAAKRASAVITRLLQRHDTTSLRADVSAIAAACCGSRQARVTA